jgi:hypothetical protein
LYIVALINEKVHYSYHTEEEAYSEGLLNQMRAIEDMTKKKPTNLLQLKHDSILELCRYLKDDLTNYKARFEYLSSQCTELFNIRGITYKVLETNSLHGQEINESIFRTRVRNFQDAFQPQLLDEEEDLEESNDEDDDEEEEEEVDEDDEDDDDDGEEEEEEEEEDIEQEAEDGVDADEGENGHEYEKQEADGDDIDEVEELEEEDQEDETMEAEDAAPEANDCGSEVDSEDGQLGEKRSRSQSQCDDDDEEEDEIDEDDVDEDELEEEEEEEEEEESSNKKQRMTA